MPGDEIQTTRAAETMGGAILELKLVGDIARALRVARYQRGYRRGSLEVERLLNDISPCGVLMKSTRLPLAGCRPSAG